VKRERTGRFVIITRPDDRRRAFIPHPLPPTPALKIGPRLLQLQEQALMALGRLDNLTSLLPDISCFRQTFMRKEALLSSEIAGKPSSLLNLLLYENRHLPASPGNNVREAANYMDATRYGLDRSRSGSIISARLLKEVHLILRGRGRVVSGQSGRFRRDHHPLDSKILAPPPEEIFTCMIHFEDFLFDETSEIPALIKIALAQAQFENIRPFADCNRRLARILTVLMLSSEGLLSEPVFCWSSYIKKHHAEYQDLIKAICFDGDWENWIAFFLTGIRRTADTTARMTLALRNLFKSDEHRVRSLGRASSSALRLHEAFRSCPIFPLSVAARAANISLPTAHKILDLLVQLGILHRLTWPLKPRTYAYHESLRILNDSCDLQ